MALQLHSTYSWNRYHILWPLRLCGSFMTLFIWDNKYTPCLVSLKNLEAVDSDPIQKPHRNLPAGTEKKKHEKPVAIAYISP